MRISEQEHASQLRMSAVAAAVSRALIGIVDEHPDLTYVEIATALIEVAQRKLMHARRAEVSEDETPGR